jgi:uncharacterized alpha-E superfamily protein
MAGLFMGALNDDEGYAFLRLGRAIERGDFAARVLLGALESVGDGLADSQALGAADWVGVLQSLTAFQMYRRSVQGPVTGPRVIRFLMCSTVFPRAVACCAKEATLALARLPASGPLAAAAVQLSSGLASECLSDSHEGDGTGVITISQSRLLDLHGMIAATYFPSGWDPPLMAGQTQAQFASAQGQKEVAPSRC